MKVFIETLGCPKNFNDSQVMGAILEDAGCEITDDPYNAEVIIVNTCGFINDAKRESIDTIFEYADFINSCNDVSQSNKNEQKILVVSGCLSERYGAELFDEMPEVDIFVGVNEYEKLPELIAKFKAEGKRLNGVTHVYDKKKLQKSARRLDDNPYTATVKIAEGCNNRCAYCVIPDIRGSYRSKPMEDVIVEARELAEAGCKELILIAQDPTNYGRDIYGEFKFAELVRRVCEIDGIHWVRLMYCYEDKITDELIEVMATEPKVCHYIDIPIQHASDKVLKEMNRHSTSESINSTIERLRSRMPDIHIRTTLIVGFPGETEEDFEILSDFVNEKRFERLGVFAYSLEEGTVAGEREDQVDDDIKEERLDRIMRDQLSISYEINREKIGKIFEVMVESRDEDGSYVGRTQYDAPEIDNSVLFTSRRDLKPGDFVRVKIDDAFDYDIVGHDTMTCCFVAD